MKTEAVKNLISSSNIDIKVQIIQRMVLIYNDELENEFMTPETREELLKKIDSEEKKLQKLKEIYPEYFI